MKAKIMAVDDDDGIRRLLSVVVSKAGHQFMEAASAAELAKAYDGPQPDVILLDLQLPDADGLKLLPQIKHRWPDTEVIVLTGHATIDAAVEATKQGAYHFQNKPFEQKSLLLMVERALEHKQLNEQTSSLRRALTGISGTGSLQFQSPAMKEVMRGVERVAPSEVSVLITGESGSGKEVVADLLHALSPRNKAPFIKVNCPALSRGVIEEDLFGSENGEREGVFRQAGEGTLMLDEISEMPLETQSILLRVLEEKQARPAGGQDYYQIQCRILATTNRPVEKAMEEGKLRKDLYYRISTVSIHVPPLRERREDILPLANNFLQRHAAQAGRTIKGFSKEAAEKLQNFDWPGNVRQLQNEVQRAVLMCDGNQIKADDLSIRPAATEAEMVEELTMMEAVERNTIIQALKQTGGNKVETAKRLGIGRQTLYNKIKAYGIEA